MAYISNKEIKKIIKNNKLEIKALEKKNKAYSKDDYITSMKDDNNVVEFEELKTYFYTDNGVVKAVNGVTFEVPSHSIVGIVGESGCGKSVTSLSLMRLLQGPTGQIVDGSIRFKASDGVVYDIAKMPLNKMSSIRGKDITMIFQEPMTSLNPVFTIGNQLDEVSLLHNNYDKQQSKAHSIEMLKLVGIPDAEMVYGKYPHELSGGMRQRVMIAMALAAKPKLIVADEPTTALDVTIQAQILDLLRDIQKKTDASIMLITHDLGVIAEMADYVIVMYAGKIIEKGTVMEIFDNPLHPYTVGLQKSKPRIDGNSNEPLFSIPGNVPNPINMPSYCYFKNRCKNCIEKCNGEYPKMIQVSDTHFVSCYYAQENNSKDN
ncbi:MAG: ABC transporter ATP-binding protein [Erysipelotrichaceae bacterium]|nr:ABC transporter ATP-binding protein [Erysipelotrichaceae bacterium]